MQCSMDDETGTVPEPKKPTKDTSHVRTALIVEGGGMLGAWAIGALNALHERGRDHFDLVVAASSGACSAAYFVAGMHEPALEIWQRYVDGKKLLRKGQFVPFFTLIYCYLLPFLFFFFFLFF